MYTRVISVRNVILSKRKNQLVGLGNLMGLCSCSDFIQDGGFKRFENYIIKLSARETKWTGKAARSCFSILKIFILIRLLVCQITGTSEILMGSKYEQTYKV